MPFLMDAGWLSHFLLAPNNPILSTLLGFYQNLLAYVRGNKGFFIKDGGIQNPDGSSPQERISLFADGRFPICRELCCQPVVSNELLRPDIIVCQNPNWTFEAPSWSLRSSEIGSRLLLGIETSISAPPLIRSDIIHQSDFVPTALQVKAR